MSLGAVFLGKWQAGIFNPAAQRTNDVAVESRTGRFHHRPDNLVVP